MRAIVNGRGILVVGIALLATAAMTACSANQTPGSGPGISRSIPAATATRPAAASAISPSASAPSSAAGSSAVQNLVISSTEQSDLTAAFVADKGISLSDILGADPVPGSVYYAYDPATDSYWALADFKLSSTASFNAQVSFQDGGDMGLFRKTQGGPWQMQGGSLDPVCAELQFFPPAVLAAWSMPTSAPSPGPAC
jgi:hypothetical protein